MCEFLLGKGAEVNRYRDVSKSMSLVCRWMWWGRDIVVVGVCAHVDSHLSFHINLTGLLGRGMVVVCMFVCKQSS